MKYSQIWKKKLLPTNSELNTICTFIRLDYIDSVMIRARIYIQQKSIKYAVAYHKYVKYFFFTN